MWFDLDRAEHDPAWREQLQAGPLPRAEVASRLREKIKQFTAENAEDAEKKE